MSRRLDRAQVIPAKRWEHPDGSTASVYGAPPYGEGWRVVQVGWTIRWGDGTVGNGPRPPFQSEQAAEDWLSSIRNRE